MKRVLLSAFVLVAGTSTLLLAGCPNQGAGPKGGYDFADIPDDLAGGTGGGDMSATPDMTGTGTPDEGGTSDM